MQRLCSGVVPLLFGLVWVQGVAAAPKVHSVTLGTVRKVPYLPPEANVDNKAEEAATLRVRPLLVDGVQKEWTVGEMHEVTDRTFVVRRAMRINDSLPSEPAKWSWQPGPWLMVDRVTGHIAALHLPAFDPAVSDVVWFRDYAAYCGIATTAKGGLVAVVAEVGTRKAVVQKPIGPWPQVNAPHPVCGVAKWERIPMRVTIQPAGKEAITFEVVGMSSLVEEGEDSEAQ